MTSFSDKAFLLVAENSFRGPQKPTDGGKSKKKKKKKKVYSEFLKIVKRNKNAD